MRACSSTSSSPAIGGRRAGSYSTAQLRAHASVARFHLEGGVRHPLAPAPRLVCEASASQPSDLPPGSSSLSSSSSQSASDAYASRASDNGVYPPGVQAAKKPGLLQRVKEYFLGSKVEKDKLAALGMGAFASYGVISNLTYGTCLTIAWITFVKTTGKSPLAPGQWGPFLLVYGGYWAVQNFVRPLRFALAVALAPAFERAIIAISSKLGAPKPVGFTVVLILIALFTFTAMGSALYLFGGFPDGLPALPFFNKAPATA